MDQSSNWTRVNSGCDNLPVTFSITPRLFRHMLTQYQQAISQYRQRVFSFAYYSLRAREDAEDITIEWGPG